MTLIIKVAKWRITQKYLHSWNIIIVNKNQMSGYLEWCVIWWIISLSNKWQELNRFSQDRKVEILTLHSFLKEDTYLFISKTFVLSGIQTWIYIYTHTHIYIYRFSFKLADRALKKNELLISYNIDIKPSLIIAP